MMDVLLAHDGCPISSVLLAQLAPALLAPTKNLPKVYLCVMGVSSY